MNWIPPAPVYVVALAMTILCVFPVVAHSQARSPLMATVMTVAPIYIGPKVQTVPLRTAAVGTRLEVLTEEGDWVQVRFGDPVFGPRVGWVQANLIRIERPELQPMDLSVPPPQRPQNVERSRDATVRGQDDPVERTDFERSGFLVGFSVGYGLFSCEDCDWTHAVAGDFHIGGMVNERVGLMYDNLFTVAVIDDEIWSLDTMTFAVQSFGRRAWVKGGAGLGVITCQECFSFPVAEVGLAVMGGAGGELVQRGRFALDLQGRFTLNFFEGIRFYSTMATVGFNWY